MISIKNKYSVAALLGMLAGFSTTPSAALFDRGSGLIYDDVLDITWLQDANYAFTSGYTGDGVSSTNGLMLWSAATQWAEDLVYYDAIRDVNYDDWRLPSVSAENGVPVNWGNQGYYSGSVVSQSSELAHLYHVTLGNGFAPVYQSALENTGPFINFDISSYWYGTKVTFNSYTYGAFQLNTDTGTQQVSGVSHYRGAWAVRDGDVAAVPLPSAVWLFGSVLVGFIGLGRRIKQ